MKKAIYLMSALFLTTACNALEPPRAEIFPDGDVNNMNVRTNDSHFTEGDMVDPIDNNPNFLDLNTENVSSNNIGNFQAMMGDVVRASDKFEPGMIFTHGNRAYVNVRPKGDYTERDVNELRTKLVKAMPRYQIDVNVRE